MCEKGRGSLIAATYGAEAVQRCEPRTYQPICPFATALLTPYTEMFNLTTQPFTSWSRDREISHHHYCDYCWCHCINSKYLRCHGNKKNKIHRDCQGALKPMFENKAGGIWSIDYTCIVNNKRNA